MKPWLFRLYHYLGNHNILFFQPPSLWHDLFKKWNNVQSTYNSYNLVTTGLNELIRRIRASLYSSRVSSNMKNDCPWRNATWHKQASFRPQIFYSERVVNEHARRRYVRSEKMPTLTWASFYFGSIAKSAWCYGLLVDLNLWPSHCEEEHWRRSFGKCHMFRSF